MHDVYKEIENYNLNKRRKVLIVFDDMIADISIVFITQSYFKVPKDVKFYTLFYYENSK